MCAHGITINDTSTFHVAMTSCPLIFTLDFCFACRAFLLEILRVSANTGAANTTPRPVYTMFVLHSEKVMNKIKKEHTRDEQKTKTLCETIDQLQTRTDRIYNILSLSSCGNSMIGDLVLNQKLTI